MINMKKKTTQFQKNESPNFHRDCFFNIVLWKLLHQILWHTLRWGLFLVLIIGYQHSLYKIESVYIIKGVKPLSQEYSIEHHPQLKHEWLIKSWSSVCFFFPPLSSGLQKQSLHKYFFFPIQHKSVLNGESITLLWKLI